MITLWKSPARPRAKAPDIDIQGLVQALQQNIKSDMVKGAVNKGEPLFHGTEELRQDGKVSKDTLAKNADVLKALLSISNQGLFRREQLRKALMVFDGLMGSTLSAKRSKFWADEDAFLLGAFFCEAQGDPQEYKYRCQTSYMATGITEGIQGQPLPLPGDVHPGAGHGQPGRPYVGSQCQQCW